MVKVKFRKKGSVGEHKIEGNLLDLETLRFTEGNRRFTGYRIKNVDQEVIDLSDIPVVHIHVSKRLQWLVRRVKKFLDENPNFRGAIFASNSWRGGWGSDLLVRYEHLRMGRVPRDLLEARKKRQEEIEAAEAEAITEAEREAELKAHAKRIAALKARANTILQGTQVFLPEGAWRIEVRIANENLETGDFLLVFSWNERWSTSSKSIHVKANSAKGQVEAATQKIHDFLASGGKVDNLFVNLDKEA